MSPSAHRHKLVNESLVELSLKQFYNRGTWSLYPAVSNNLKVTDRLKKNIHDNKISGALPQRVDYNTIVNLPISHASISLSKRMTYLLTHQTSDVSGS